MAQEQFYVGTDARCENNWRNDGPYNIIYVEQGNILFLSGSRQRLMAGFSKGRFTKDLLELNSVFARFDPPNDDEMISDSHWQTISDRIAEIYNAKVILRTSGVKSCEGIWNVLFDESVRSVYRWHDNGKDIDLKRIQRTLPSGETYVELLLDTEPQWLSGLKLTEREILRMKSYVKELARERVEFICK